MVIESLPDDPHLTGLFLQDSLEELFNQREDVIKFTDFDVSATKLTMDDRPALCRMLKLIKQGEIDTVIVYERDRLARNVYEYIAIAQVFYQHDIEVIYTPSDAQPFHSDLFVETWFGLSAQF